MDQNQKRKLFFSCSTEASSVEAQKLNLQLFCVSLLFLYRIKSVKYYFSPLLEINGAKCYSNVENKSLKFYNTQSSSLL